MELDDVIFTQGEHSAKLDQLTADMATVKPIVLKMGQFLEARDARSKKLWAVGGSVVTGAGVLSKLWPWIRHKTP